ncbi:MAG: monovalent cation/H+ antiporter subunit D family protein [Firmicutes bacterium]|nr:monovalent cation/H+ antiporter subunit D family protein [Bacillota bacterium]
MNVLITLIILLPIAGAAAIWLPGLRSRPVVAPILAAGGVALAVWFVGRTPEVAPVVTWWQVVPGLPLAFRVDHAGWLFALLAAALWVPATAYANSYSAHHPHKRRRFFTFYTLSLTATMGIALAANFFTLYLFYELLTFVTWPLVIHNETPAAKRAGKLYLIYSLAGAALVLAAMVVTWATAGTLDFAVGGVIGSEISIRSIRLLVVLLVAGFGVKAAVMPLHTWLPTAMAAPTPVSALLHAVAVVNAGCFGLVRTFYSLVGTSALERAALADYLIPVAAVTIILGSVIALRQDHLKRRLAYSTVSQLGYITLGVISGHAGLLLGSLVHFVNHALMKITLFFCAGAIISETGVENISEMDGMGRRMPMVMGAFTLAALGLVGVIPINGFQSKWSLFQGALAAERPEIIVILLISAMLNAFYFFPIIGAAFFRGTGRWQQERVSSGLVWPPLLTAILCVIFGLLPALLYPYLSETVQVLMN